MGKVNFFNQDVEFKLKHSRKLSTWIKEIILKEKASLIEVNYIFCSDEYLLKLNQKYLNHNTLTDIITFDNSDDTSKIEGDIFISIERVLENSVKLNVTFETELHRVMSHGVLHLLGYKDKKPDEVIRMRKKEDAYLSLRKLS